MKADVAKQKGSGCEEGRIDGADIELEAREVDNKPKLPQVKAQEEGGEKLRVEEPRSKQSNDGAFKVTQQAHGDGDAETPAGAGGAAAAAEEDDIPP